MATASIGGIFWPMYAKETPSLAAQGIGQDWVNLLVATPLLIAASISAHFNSRRGKLVLGGALAYTGYSYVVYAFGVHFNALFLVYCAALGLSIFGLAAVLQEDASGWFSEEAPRRTAAWAEIAIAAMFAFVWLSDIVPALVSGGIPRAVAQDGLTTNPVHVLDLSVVLPALVLGGVALLRKRPIGYLLTPILLTLAVLMSIAIGGMVVAVRLQGLETDVAVAGLFGVIAVVCGAILARMLGAVRN